MKLATKLILIFLLLSLIPVIIVGYVAYDHGRKTIEDDTLENLISINAYKATQFTGWMNSNETAVDILSAHSYMLEKLKAMGSLDRTDPAYREARQGIVDRLFAAAIEGVGLDEMFLLRASDGLVFVSSNEAREGQYGVGEPFFEEGKQGMYVQTVCCQSPPSSTSAIVIGMPVKDNQGNLVAVLAGRVDIQELSSDILARGADSKQTQNTCLIDESYQFVTVPEFGKGNVQDQAVLAVNREAPPNPGGPIAFHGLYHNYRGVPVIGAGQWIPEWKLYIQTEVDQAEAFTPVRNLRNIILIIGAGMALGVIFLALFFSRTITLPVRRLSQGAEEISRGNLDYRMNAKDRDELGDLSRSFDRMAETLRTTTVSRDKLTVEIAERKRAQENINRRLEFEKTIAIISARFVGNDDIDSAIKEALQDMAVLSGAHRAYLFLLREDSNIIDNTHEWCAEGVSPQISNLQGIPCNKFEGVDKMRSGEGMHIPDVSMLSLENTRERNLRLLLESQEIKSLIIVPLFMANRWAGLIGFDNVSTAGKWKEDDRALLQLSADIIGNALEKTRAWKALAASEERYRLHFQNASDIIVSFDTEIRILDVSPSIETMLGYTPSELIGRKAVDVGIISEKSAQEIVFNLNHFLPGEAMPPRTYRFICKNGTIKLGEVTNTPLIVEGKITAYTSVVRDVTERRQAERALRESEEKYRTVVNNIPDTVWIVEQGKGIAFVSPNVQAIMGCAPEELRQGGIRGWLGNVHPDDLNNVKIALRALDEEGIYFAIEHRFRRKDGEWLWLYTRAVNSYEQDGKRYFYGLTSDITDRKRAEKQSAIQQNLAQSLSATDELDKGAALCLEAAIAASGMDSGGIYLVDEDTGGIRLVCHHGLSADFIDSVSYYGPDSPNTRLVMNAVPLYTEFSKVNIPSKEAEQMEGLRAIAILPIVHEGRLVACLHVTSHTEERFSVHARIALEQITGHVGEGIARLVAEEALRHSEERYRLHFENVSDVIAEFDQELRLIDVSPSAERLGGYVLAELMGKRWLEIGVIAEDSLQELHHNLDHIFAGETLPNPTYKFISKDGAVRFGEVTHSPIFSEGKAVTYLAVIRDVTERRQAEEELRRLSVTDELTGVPNRRRFYDVVETEINRALADGSSFSLVMLDLDRFKLYNDTYGHTNGDKVLQEFARLLETSLKNNDMVFRYGGDEFILLVRSTHVKKADKIARRIRQKWEERVKSSFPSSEMLLQISAGIVDFPDDGDTIDSLMNLVDIALYQSKRRGGATTTRVSDLDELAASGVLGLATLDQIYALAAAVDARDKEMYGHATRVAGLCERIGKAMGLTQMDLVKLHSAAILHDIGKFGVSDAILSKPGKPTEEEWALLTRHSAEGAKIVEHVKDLADIVPDIRHHHEWYDGSGYPGRLKSIEIPIRARIISVADTYDTLTSARSYADVMSHTEAMAELQRCSGSQFDPAIIGVFFRVMGEQQSPMA
ncbi:MAG: PAS domain S-box protein [Dehalococcoidia bacterium]|nr:PAS domain S-box protein [Dehalococcoidia bacterium]